MKTALCISGQARAVRFNFPNVERAILNVLNPDVFVHTWDKEDFHNKDPRTAEGTRDIFLYDPKRYLIEEQIIFEQHDLDQILDYTQYSWEQKEWMFQRVKSMFYSIKQANELRKQYEADMGTQYDCVIRFRFDINPQLAFDVADFERFPDALSVYSYDFGGGPHGYPPKCYGDQVAYGSPAALNVYSSTYDHIQRGVQAIQRIHAGSLLTWTIDKVHEYPYVRDSAFTTAAQDKLVRD